IRSADAPTTVTTLAIAPSGQKFAVGRGADVLVCDVADGKERLQLRGPSSSVSDIAFSADGISMATARGNGEIQLWDSELGERKHVLRAHTGPAIRCRFAGAGHRLVSVGLDGAFRLWNTETAELLWSEPGDGHGLREVVASPDGRTAAVGGFAGIVRIYDLDARCERQTLDQHTRSITALRFISGGALLISAGDEGTIRYWDTAADFAMVGCFEFGSSRY
ncbi:MAG TPA: hypothetical protein VL475_00135, partial [Planctomycetaceae bacterium]|nr:hypothetical protein [Planctomycetaceae bacterium]